MRISLLYGDPFGEKVLGNLINYSSFCESCGLACSNCRNQYPSFASDIVEVVNLPSKLPSFLERPDFYFPRQLEPCDLILAIGLHPDLMTYIPDIVGKTGSKAVIIPIERRNWCLRGLRKQLEDIFEDIGIEISFPKPFCSLKEEKGVIGDFCKSYRVGKPRIEVVVENDTVTATSVKRSAPCGSTWYVAQQIRWRRLRELEEIIAKSHHAYPCTADMELDPEVGDTLLHVAGYLAREAVLEAIGRQTAKTELPSSMR
ncbi:MAG: DUF166 domain-containing protein [Candidatus Bathyarchaeia archaeon]